MTKNLDDEGLRSIIKNYDLFFIDLWGVIHNGIKLHEKAIDVLTKISETKKKYILLTNAPRPNNVVKIFLKKMGMNKNMRENVYTSGEAALSYLKKNYIGQSFYHIGPPRDFDLFIDFKNNKTQDITFEVYDLYGKLILNGAAPTISLKPFERGTYLVRVKIGNYFQMFKVIRD